MAGEDGEVWVNGKGVDGLVGPGDQLVLEHGLGYCEGEVYES